MRKRPNTAISRLSLERLAAVQECAASLAEMAPSTEVATPHIDHASTEDYDSTSEERAQIAVTRINGRRHFR